jgi:RNA polymerase sigma factor (sigma-70 family)
LLIIDRQHKTLAVQELFKLSFPSLCPHQLLLGFIALNVIAECGSTRGVLDFTSDSFKALLSWLDSDPQSAGQKYEIIRAGLIRIFISRGFSDAEDLADITIDRVIARLPDISQDYVGEPAKYFHGVARKIILEAGRRKEISMADLPERIERSVNTNDEYECLLRCLNRLTPEKRELILDYHRYDYEEREKIEHHREMAEEQKIGETTLRVRAHRLRVALEKCIQQCMEGIGMKQNTPRRPLPEKRDEVSARSWER